jgi:hypothetical protein
MPLFWDAAGGRVTFNPDRIATSLLEVDIEPTPVVNG